MEILRPITSLFLLIGILWLASSNRRAISWSLVLKGLIIQFILAFLILELDWVSNGFDWIGKGFVSLLGFAREGSLFLFGDLVGNTDSFGYIFAFQVLPTIIFFSAITSLFFHFGILQKVVFVFAWFMKRTLKLSGAESLSAAANVFVGQTEAPLLVKPYIKGMTRSELMCLMTGGMSTIAGAVLAAYINYLGGDDPERQVFFARHLLAASVMSAPAAIVGAKILLPETENFVDSAEVKINKQGNWLEAIAHGTADGLKMSVNVGVMLLVFTAIIALINALLNGVIGSWTGLNEFIESSTSGRYTEFNLQSIFGIALAPLTWLMGVPWSDAASVGQLLGEKTVLNEFYAYVSMEGLMNSGQLNSEKAQILSTYILCGFANFASIGIQIGGIGALAPSRRKELSELGLRALLAGTAASLFTAILVGILY
ncbi:MAG: NupC/NupG family nucleoside CNT transporter [Schleiferiaceae bacterium]|jgi:CNT family concentrative nucleoside transporter|tara:strand:- start:26468 stop:27751 length:1284 start_codon:yes stop_codon:yes gene_type:complete